MHYFPLQKVNSFCLFLVQLKMLQNNDIFIMIQCLMTSQSIIILVAMTLYSLEVSPLLTVRHRSLDLELTTPQRFKKDW